MCLELREHDLESVRAKSSVMVDRVEHERVLLLLQRTQRELQETRARLNAASGAGSSSSNAGGGAYPGTHDAELGRGAFDSLGPMAAALGSSPAGSKGAEGAEGPAPPPDDDRRTGGADRAGSALPSRGGAVDPDCSRTSTPAGPAAASATEPSRPGSVQLIFRPGSGAGAAADGPPSDEGPPQTPPRPCDGPCGGLGRSTSPPSATDPSLHPPSLSPLGALRPLQAQPPLPPPLADPLQPMAQPMGQGLAKPLAQGLVARQADTLAREAALLREEQQGAEAEVGPLPLGGSMAAEERGVPFMASQAAQLASVTTDAAAGTGGSHGVDGPGGRGGGPPVRGRAGRPHSGALPGWAESGGGALVGSASSLGRAR